MFSVDPLPSQQCIIIGRGQRNVCFYTDTGLPSDSHSGLTPFIKVVTKRAMARCTIGQPKDTHLGRLQYDRGPDRYPPSPDADARTGVV